MNLNPYKHQTHGITPATNVWEREGGGRGEEREGERRRE